MLQLAYCLRGEIRSATSSLTSVPKPLKLLCGSYDDLRGLFEELKLKVSSRGRGMVGGVMGVV